MLYAIACLVIAVFIAALAAFRIVPAAMKAMTTSRSVLKTLSDPALDDDDREQAVQRAAMSLLGSFVSITVRGGGALFLSWLVIYLADRAGAVPAAAVIDFLSSAEVIIISSVVLTIAWLLWKKR